MTHSAKDHQGIMKALGKRKFIWSQNIIPQITYKLQRGKESLEWRALVVTVLHKELKLSTSKGETT